MNTFLLNAVAVVVALILLFGVWIGVHLLARRRMGERKLGCRGPTFDEQGNSVCCHSGQPCDRIEDTRHAD